MAAEFCACSLSPFQAYFPGPSSMEIKSKPIWYQKIARRAVRRGLRRTEGTNLVGKRAILCFGRQEGQEALLANICLWVKPHTLAGSHYECNTSTVGTGCALKLIRASTPERVKLNRTITTSSLYSHPNSPVHMPNKLYGFALVLILGLSACSKVSALSYVPTLEAAFFLLYFGCNRT